MKILRPLLLAFAISFCADSYAADIELEVGSVSCKEWLADRATKSDYINKNVDQSWVLGFLSGYATVTGERFLDNTKTQTIFKWMDKFCASHPSALIDDGALNLAHELTQRMHK